MIKYLHIYKYLHINKLASFIPGILKSSPKEEREGRDMALDQEMTIDLRKQAEADQDLCSGRVAITVIAPGITFQIHRRDCHKPRHLSNTSPKAFSILPARDDRGMGLIFN